MAPQVVDPFDRRLAAIPLDDLRREPVEHVWRQSERSQPLKLPTLLSSVSMLTEPRIGKKLMQRYWSVLSRQLARIYTQLSNPSVTTGATMISRSMRSSGSGSDSL